MREILFRGKDNGVLNNQWQFGSADFTNEMFPQIIRKDRFGNKMYITVDEETVGQFTGLTDKNGKKIFEGDICRIHNLLYKVEFKYSCWWLTILSSKVYCCPAFNSHCGASCEIIGNIHDNPELLGGTEDGETYKTTDR